MAVTSRCDLFFCIMWTDTTRTIMRFVGSRIKIWTSCGQALILVSCIYMTVILIQKRELPAEAFETVMSALQ